MIEATIFVCTLASGPMADGVAHEMCLEAEDLKADHGWRVITTIERHTAIENVRASEEYGGRRTG